MSKRPIDWHGPESDTWEDRGFPPPESASASCSCPCASCVTLRQQADNAAMNKDLPPSLAASIDLFREDPDAWHAEWRRTQEFKVALIKRAEAAEAEVSTLRQQIQALEKEIGKVARAKNYAHGRCGADLRCRLCEAWDELEKLASRLIGGQDQP